jgi:hypothetical protein
MNKNEIERQTYIDKEKLTDRHNTDGQKVRQPDRLRSLNVDPDIRQTGVCGFGHRGEQVAVSIDKDSPGCTIIYKTEEIFQGRWHTDVEMRQFLCVYVCVCVSVVSMRALTTCMHTPQHHSRHSRIAARLCDINNRWR